MRAQWQVVQAFISGEGTQMMTDSADGAGNQGAGASTGPVSAEQVIPPQTKDAPGPGSPLELGKAGWRDTLKRSATEFKADRAPMTAGSLAYHWFLSLFPAIIALLGIASLAGLSAGTVHHLEHGVDKAVPGGVANVFNSAITTVLGRSASGSLTAVIVGVLVALWSASSGMAALQTGLDVAYDVPTDRKFLAKRLYAVPLMLAIAVLGGIATALVVFGAPLGSVIEGHAGLTGTAFTVVWTIVRWVLTIIVITVLFSAFYYLGPTGKTHTGNGSAPAACSARRSSCSRRWAFRSMCPSSAATARPTARSPV